MPGFINSQVVVLFTKDKLTPQNLLASAFRAILPDYNNHLETVGDIVNYSVFWIRYQAPDGTSNIVFNSELAWNPHHSLSEMVSRQIRFINLAW